MTGTVVMRNAKTELNHDTGEATLKLINVEVKVSADGQNVSIKTNDGFQTVKAPAPAEGASKGAYICEGSTKAVLNGVTIEQADDGHLIIAGNYKYHFEHPSEERQAGQLTKEGIFFAISTDENGKKWAWYADIDDAKDSEGKTLSANFNERAAYAQERNQQNHLGHNDWVVASAWTGKKGDFNALSTLFDNRVKVGGFDATAQYGSSSSVHQSDSGYVQVMDFKTGVRGAVEESTRQRFRLVRKIAI